MHDDADNGGGDDGVDADARMQEKRRTLFLGVCFWALWPTLFLNDQKFEVEVLIFDVFEKFMHAVPIKADKKET